MNIKLFSKLNYDYGHVKRKLEFFSRKFLEKFDSSKWDMTFRLDTKDSKDENPLINANLTFIDHHNKGKVFQAQGHNIDMIIRDLLYAVRRFVRNNKRLETRKVARHNVLREIKREPLSYKKFKPNVLSPY